jgi:hypothetical protein
MLSELEPKMDVNVNETTLVPLEILKLMKLYMRLIWNHTISQGVETL